MYSSEMEHTALWVFFFVLSKKSFCWNSFPRNFRNLHLIIGIDLFFRPLCVRDNLVLSLHNHRGKMVKSALRGGISLLNGNARQSTRVEPIERETISFFHRHYTTGLRGMYGTAENESVHNSHHTVKSIIALWKRLDYELRKF